MQEDSESALLRELAEVKGIKGELSDIKGEISKLRSDYKKLSKRIDQIEILGLQEQINSLADVLLTTQRVLARLHMHHEFNNFCFTLLSQKPEIYNEVYAQLTVDLTALRIQADTSMTPLPLAQQFQQKCRNYADQVGLKKIDLY